MLTSRVECVVDLKADQSWSHKCRRSKYTHTRPVSATNPPMAALNVSAEEPRCSTVNRAGDSNLITRFYSWWTLAVGPGSVKVKVWHQRGSTSLLSSVLFQRPSTMVRVLSGKLYNVRIGSNALAKSVRGALRNTQRRKRPNKKFRERHGRSIPWPIVPGNTLYMMRLA